jgi:hypothetical protein
MAWTTTKKAQYNEGNVVVQHWALTADSATLELSTGLKNVVSVQHAVKSANSANYKVKSNELSAATASYGSVAITGCTSGDDLYLVIYGN